MMTVNSFTDKKQMRKEKIMRNGKRTPAGIFFLLLLTLFIYPVSVSAATPGLSASAVVSKAAQKISSTSGIRAKFKAVSGGRSVSGTLLASANRFSMVVAGAPSSWYNGKDLWTYNPSTGEATVMKPTPQDLAEVNPLNYIRRGATSFNAAFAKTQPTGRYVVELTPKSNKEGVKKVTLTVSRSSLLPEKVTVTTPDGRSATVTISSIETNMRIGLGNYEFPRQKYPKAEIVDLR